MNDQDVIVRGDSWWPQLLSTQRAPSAARYELRFRGEQILDRAEMWTDRRDTALGEFVHRSLRTYLDIDDAQDRANRRERILGAFREVIGVAPPLVQFNSVLSESVHGDVPDSQFHFTAVPFAQTDLEKEMLAIVENSGQSESVLKNLKGAMGLGDEQRVEIITTLNAPVQPVVLQSVMRPIAAQWSAARDNDGTREQFWRWRRARSLPEFVPASQEVIDSMSKGWFLGRLLGELVWDKQQFAAHPVQIWDPEYKRLAAFPFPYLGGNPSTEQDLFPAVMESMSLAMLDCQINGNMSPLKPYTYLRAIGDEATLHLRNWVQFGTTPHGTAPMERAWKVKGGTAASPESASTVERQQAVVTYLEGRMRNYVDRLDQDPVNKSTLLTQPRWLDLRDQLEHAFRALMDDANNVPTYEADDGGD